jgi:hypothetical protein
VADHATDTEPGRTSEPVLIAHVVTVLLGGVVGLGWLTLSDSTINLVGTVVFILVSTVGAVVARGRVRPVDGTDRALTPDDVVAYVDAVLRDELAALEARKAATRNSPPLGG